MKTSLDNQGAMVQEFAESRSRDKRLRQRFDMIHRRQEGFGHLMLEILSLSAASESMVKSDDYCSTTASLKAEIVNAVENTPSEMQDMDTERLEISPNRLAGLRKLFINIFRYDSMFDREAGVAEAHPDTLKWIFKDSSTANRKWDNFGEWLESQDRLYWITGKMGSGKSTLMKYISEELPTTSTTGKTRRCTPYLLRWAQDQPLLIATFYFWAGSSDKTGIQTSVEGMYRTILTQILEAYPEASEFASPSRWEKLVLFNGRGTPPGAKELKNILARTIAHVSSIARICLFIDGLDELEGDTEDLKDLIEWVKQLVATLPVKLCVASRPWRVFEDALQGGAHLLVENINYKDIQQYVWSKFHQDANFRDRKQVEANFCDEMLDEIVTKADGVFLWVHVVSALMLEAMSRGDLISDMRRTLKALPAEMENLYAHILDTLEPRDRDQASKYFLLLQTCSEPDALIFSFADEDIEYCLEMSDEPLTDTQLRHRASELKKRLNSRCRGILSLSMDHVQLRDPTSDVRTATVQYCHRSAKDYLTMREVQEKLIAGPFDPHLRLCSAYMARWKCGASEGRAIRREFLYRCIDHARQVTSEGSNMMVQVLDDLRPDLETRAYLDPAYFKDAGLLFGGTFVSFALVLGVEEYVKSKIGHGQGCVVRSSFVHWPSHFPKLKQGESVEWPLLVDALLSAALPKPNMVALLLENGADPNLVIRGLKEERTVFGEVVSHLKGLGAWVHPAWQDSLCLLLQHGAKPRREDVQLIRRLIGRGEIHKRKLPHLGRHRVLISKYERANSRLKKRMAPLKKTDCAPVAT